MKVITEGFKCVVTEEEYLSGEADGYSFIFIVGNDGTIYKETKLTHGRFIRTRIEQLPDSKPTQISSNINFFPAGKVPIVFLHQIIKFFREVMTTLKAGPEAMIHILWNPEKGYFLSVPTQTVSKASVKYEYDHMEPGDIIVVDIHSHNTMGAFFSSTDNTDDQNSLCYSGVIGKLDKPEPEMKFRFNNNKEKLECSLADIFDTGVESVKVPSEWLSKVKVSSYPNYNRNSGYLGYPGYGGTPAGQGRWSSYQQDLEDARLGKNQGRTPDSPADIGQGAVARLPNPARAYEDILAGGLEGLDDDEIEEIAAMYRGESLSDDMPLISDLSEDEEEDFAQVMTWLEGVSSPDKIQEIIEECNMKLQFQQEE